MRTGKNSGQTPYAKIRGRGCAPQPGRAAVPEEADRPERPERCPDALLGGDPARAQRMAVAIRRRHHILERDRPRCGEARSRTSRRPSVSSPFVRRGAAFHAGGHLAIEGQDERGDHAVRTGDRDPTGTTWMPIAILPLRWRRNGRFAEAIPHFRILSRAQPNDPFSRFGLAMSYREAGRPDEARDALRRLVERYPQELQFQQASTPLRKSGRVAITGWPSAEGQSRQHPPPRRWSAEHQTCSRSTSPQGSFRAAANSQNAVRVQQFRLALEPALIACAGVVGPGMAGPGELRRIEHRPVQIDTQRRASSSSERRRHPTHRKDVFARPLTSAFLRASAKAGSDKSMPTTSVAPARAACRPKPPVAERVQNLPFGRAGRKTTT